MEPTYTAFLHSKRLAFGTLDVVLRVLIDEFERDPGSPVLVFEDATGKQVDFDLRGSFETVLKRASRKPPQPAPGRPKLGVVAREISLLPRHWEWLEQQPNGASAAIRRLVDEARKTKPEKIRQGREAAGRFMTAVAGNFAGFEEALRAIYAGSRSGFEKHTEEWPADVRMHAAWLCGEGLNAP